MYESQPVRFTFPQRDRQRNGLAFDFQTSLVGRVKAREDLDQCRLAGPVLAKQPVDFAGHNGKVRARQRACPSENLGQATDRQTRSRRAGHSEIIHRSLNPA